MFGKVFNVQFESCTIITTVSFVIIELKIYLLLAPLYIYSHIAMQYAKITPASGFEEIEEAYPNLFIIRTKDGKHYALTADTTETCRQWVKELQIVVNSFVRIGIINEQDGEKTRKAFFNAQMQMRFFDITNLETNDIALGNESIKSTTEHLHVTLKTLIDEVEMKLTQKDKMIDKLKERVNYLEEELMNYRTKYVNLLSDSFKIPLTLADADAVEVPDIVEEKLKCELFEMIANETSPDSPLRTIAEYPVVDRYGEKHHWDDSDIHQYLCRELYLHFTKMEQDNLMDMWQSYLGTLKKINGYIFELPNSNNKKKELKGILRKGVPLQLRSQVWSSLVHYHTGKEREMMDSIASTAKRKSYYESLLDSKSVYHKHIDADTPRTFPFNIHFAFKGIGCDRVKRVLTAYSNHRGLYSSGMNMVAGIGLLFLDEETTFWFMVAILEKLYPKDYDDKGSKLGIVVDQVSHTRVTTPIVASDNHEGPPL
jgi:hypothetical protein